MEKTLEHRKKLKNIVEKFKGTRHSPELNAGCIWKWREKPSCFSQHRMIFNYHYITSEKQPHKIMF